MKTKQYSIADILHYAADKCLIVESRYERRERFSCCAIDEALYELNGSIYSHPLRNRIFDGLKNMGCDVNGMSQFVKYGDEPNVYTSINPEVQGMRYMWLKWAALMAEEQGV